MPSLRPLLIGLAISCGACGRGHDSPTVLAVPTPLLCVAPSRPSSVVPAPAGVLPCPTVSDIESLQAAVQLSFEGSTALGTLVCRAAEGSQDLTRVQERAYQALLWMRRVRFDAPLPWTNETLYEWFRGTITGIRFRSDIRSSFCCEPGGVINLMVVGDGTPEASIPGFPLEVMVHEARHIEFGTHRCYPFDVNVAELGAYGVQYSMLLWIAKHDPGATPREREWALNRAAWVRYSGFCQECD